MFYKYLPYITSPLIKVYRIIWPSKLAAIKRLHYKPYARQISIHGNQFKIFLNSNNGLVDNYIHEHGTWEEDLLDVLDKYLTKDSVFIDIGANIGFISLYASRTCKKVISFEPIDFIYNQFTKSIDENSITNIDLRKHACGAKQDCLNITLVKGNIGASGILPNGNNKKCGKQKIDINTLDNALKNEKKVDLIKIDVEGFEPDVFAGASTIIHDAKPIIIFEFSPRIYENRKNKSSFKLLKSIFDMNYSLLDISNDKVITQNNYKYFILMSLLKNSQANILCTPNKHA